MAAIEMGILLPLLLLIVLGCIDFGRFAYTYIAVSNGAREGAYFASTQPRTVGTHEQWVANIRHQVAVEMGAAFDPDLLVVTLADPIFRTEQPSGFRRVPVGVGYPFETIVPWPGIPAAMMVRRAVEMRVLW